MREQIINKFKSMSRQQRSMGMAFITFAIVVGNVANADNHKQSWDHMNKS